MLRATRAYTGSTSQLLKVLRALRVLHILTWKRASRHNSVHFFDISISESGPGPSAFYTLTWKCASHHNGVHFFDIATSKSAPQLRCFVHFYLEMCFAPQRRAIFINFLSLIWPAGSAPAASASLLFDPPEPQIIGRTQWIATFLPFRAPASSFFSPFLLSLSSLILSLLFFSSWTIFPPEDDLEDEDELRRRIPQRRIPTRRRLRRRRRIAKTKRRIAKTNSPIHAFHWTRLIFLMHSFVLNWSGSFEPLGITRKCWKHTYHTPSPLAASIACMQWAKRKAHSLIIAQSSKTRPQDSLHLLILLKQSSVAYGWMILNIGLFSWSEMNIFTSSHAKFKSERS